MLSANEITLSKSSLNALKNIQKRLNKGHNMYKESKGKDANHHLGFQAPNPMTMTDFEREETRKDMAWQEDIRRRQVEGMQGYYGGKFPNQQC
jgi:hypothetical protein